MFGLGYNLLMAAKVIVLFILVYIFIPAQIIRFKKEANNFLDKVFISLIHSTIITILIVHCLAFLKLYETLSLLFCYLVAYVILVWLRGRSLTAVADAMGMKFVINLLDLSEGRSGLIGEAKKSLKEWRRGQKNNALLIIRNSVINPFTGLLPVGVLIAAAYIRFEHSIFHAAYSTSDTYLHLAWVKFLGSNQIYHDGIYSYGYHTVISSLAKLTFIDPYWLCRFIGPLGGVLIVLSVYYFALRVTQSHVASLISLVVYGLLTDGHFPMLIYRQTSALPQEYATVFILPGLYFLWLYIKSKESSFLLLYAEALAITSLVHPFAAVYLGLWSVILLLSATLFRLINLRGILNIAACITISGIVSLLPFGIGMLIGREFYQDSFQYVQGSVSSGEFMGNNTGFMLDKLVAHNPFLDIALVAVLFLAISLPVIRRRDWTVISVTITCCSVIMYLLYRAPELNLPKVTDPDRTGVFMSLLFAVLYACCFHVVANCISMFCRDSLKSLKKIGIKVFSLAICFAIIYVYPPGKLHMVTMEYDAAAENYLRIKNSFAFDVFDWTIVAPAEQFQQVVGIGWHYDLLRFVQRFNLEQARDPNFKIPIPTHHIFFYTEKIPFRLGREVTAADAEVELEPEGSDPFALYYKTTSQRAILEAKAIRWIEAYKDSHQDVTMFYEDDNMRIYHIYHNTMTL